MCEKEGCVLYAYNYDMHCFVRSCHEPQITEHHDGYRRRFQGRDRLRKQHERSAETHQGQGHGGQHPHRDRHPAESLRYVSHPIYPGCKEMVSKKIPCGTSTFPKRTSSSEVLVQTLTQDIEIVNLASLVHKDSSLLENRQNFKDLLLG